MSKILFSYSGPAQSIDIRVPEGDGTVIETVDFVPGGTVALLPDHPLTTALTAAGYLGQAPAEAVTTEPMPLVVLDAPAGDLVPLVGESPAADTMSDPVASDPNAGRSKGFAGRRGATSPDSPQE